VCWMLRWPRYACRVRACRCPGWQAEGPGHYALKGHRHGSAPRTAATMGLRIAEINEDAVAQVFRLRRYRRPSDRQLLYCSFIGSPTTTNGAQNAG
jgi:hypothetical protein